MSFRPTSARVAAIALAGLLGLSACNSTPSARRVALDTIESLDLSAAQEQCMKDVIGGYTNDELDDLGTDNENLDFANENFEASGTPEYREYVESLQACMTDGESSTTEASETSAASETTETSETTEVAETTEG